jgi:thioredoxin-related protein
MQLSLRALTLSALALLATNNLATAHDGWVADFDEAVKIARAEGKDLFVDFTGSDWCGWCKKLNAEVFDHDEFMTAAKKDFVLVALDYPHAEEVKAKVPNPKRNAELLAKYEIQGYPTILLMTADGDVFGQTGYQPGGPEKYIASLAELRTTGKKQMAEVAALVAAFDKATGPDKDKAWDAIVAALTTYGSDNPHSKKLIPAVRGALKGDADNAKGQKKRAVTALLAAGVVDEEVLTAAIALDPKNEAGLYEQAISAQFKNVDSEEGAKAALESFTKLEAAGPLKDKKVAVELYAYAAVMTMQANNDLDKAKVYAKKAKEIGSDNARLIEAMDQILGS